MCYRSWWIFSLGCYFHPCSPATAKAGYPCYSRISFSYVYGGITLYASTFQSTSTPKTRFHNAITHYISIILLWQIRFRLFRFRSPLLAESQLISFPRPTQMLHFGRFVLPSVSMGVIERPHSEILGSTVACTYPRLIAACHVLHHLSSRVILQPASLHQLFCRDFQFSQSSSG